MKLMFFLMGMISIIVGCTSIPKNDFAIPEPPPPPDFITGASRSITAVPSSSSIMPALSKVRTPEELNALIAVVEINLKDIEPEEKMIAAELLLLKNFRGIDHYLTSSKDGITSAQLIQMLSTVDINSWKKNPLVAAYLADKTGSTLFKQGEFSTELFDRIFSDFFKTAAFIQPLWSNEANKSYKSWYCPFEIKCENQVRSNSVYIKLSLAISHLTFNTAYQLTDLLKLKFKKWERKSTLIGSAVEPHIVFDNVTDMVSATITRRNKSLFALNLDGHKRMAYSFRWLREYVRAQYIDGHIRQASQAEMLILPKDEMLNGNFPFSLNEKSYRIDLQSFYSNPPIDLKALLPTEFDSVTKIGNKWNLSEYTRFFRDLQYQKDVEENIFVFDSIFPGGMPYVLKQNLLVQNILKRRTVSK